MADNPFINMLKELVAIDGDISTKTLNEKVLKYFPDKPFLPAGKKAMNYFRYLIPWKMTNLKKYNLKDILKLCNKVFPKIYKNDSVLDNTFSTLIRKPIHERFPDVNGKESPEYRDSKQLARLDYERKGELLKQQKDKVFEKNNERIEVDGLELMQIIQDGLNSQDPFRRALALSICVGTRPIELFGLSDFELDAEEPEHWIRQVALAKKKGVPAVAEKPLVYITGPKFIEEVAKLRAELTAKLGPAIIDNKLSSTYQSRNGIVAKEVFKNKFDFTFYTTRKLYVLLSYELYGKYPNRHGSNIGGVNWASKVLGHKEGSTSAAFNYSHFSLKNPEEIRQYSPNSHNDAQAQDVPENFDVPDAPDVPDDPQVFYEGNSNVPNVQLAVIETKLNNLEERLDAKTCEPVEKPIEESSNPLIDAQMAKVEEIYKAQTKKPNQTQLEKLCSSIVPRAIVRKWFHQMKIKSLGV